MRKKMLKSEMSIKTLNSFVHAFKNKIFNTIDMIVKRFFEFFVWTFLEGLQNQMRFPFNNVQGFLPNRGHKKGSFCNFFSSFWECTYRSWSRHHPSSISKLQRSPYSSWDGRQHQPRGELPILDKRVRMVPRFIFLSRSVLMFRGGISHLAVSIY